jgi:hypothetical protein
MEVLRINGSIPTVSFSDLVPSGVYTIEYSDLLTDETFSASASANGSGDISFILNDKYISYDGNLEARVLDTYDEEVIVTNIDVLRPYCDIYSLATELNKTVAQIKEMERIARYIVDSETFGGFKFVRKEKEVVGLGSDYLVIDEKIYKLYKLYENLELVYDVNAASNDQEFEISKDKTSVILTQTETNRVNYNRVWRDRYLDVDFADGFEYLVDADFGWKVIPQDIQEATRLLIGDISSDNMRYINKYIESFDNDDFKIKFAKNFNASTGNLVVDRILQKYKNNIRLGVL